EWVAGIRPGQDLEADRRVLNRARQRALENERIQARKRVGAARPRDTAPRAAVAVHVAPGGGDPNRSTTVGPLCYRDQSVRHRGRAAARRAAGVATEVERIIGRAEQV